MGQAAKLKIARAPDKKARAGTVRLHLVELRAQMVAYDEHGRATPKGSGPLEALYLMESDIPAAIVAVIRERYPKLEFDVIEPVAPTEG